MTTLGLGCCILLMSMLVNVFFAFFLWAEIRKRRRSETYKSERGMLRPMRRMRSARRRREDDSDGGGASSGDDNP